VAGGEPGGPGSATWGDSVAVGDSEQTSVSTQLAIRLGLGELFVISIADIQVFSVGLFSSS